MIFEHTHIGNGIWAKFNGKRITLIADGSAEPESQIIHLEPEVLKALLEFIQRVLPEPEEKK